ncbi:site-specific DNA-methyltransferase [Tomitella fengzijianii]|uniref:Methyltransferase n=2 Tax=Tomitella fengzijianii TaxID=2597660 RepID=A0A516X8D0_9ACTN|nr:site-specific DNA-methyltransferase [Tomitella fengzijianii]
MPTIPAATVDAIITDPPYSSGGMMRGDRAQSTTAKYVQSTSHRRGTEFTGDNRDQRAFHLWSTLWISEALRTMRPGGIIGMFTDWRQLPTTTDALQLGGAVWRGIIPWHKPNGRRTQGRPANNCEFFVWGTNGPRELADGETLDGFWQQNAPRDRVHQTQKPVALLEWLTRVCPPGGTILDPFAGSGTTLLAAKNTGRHAIGIELTAHYCQTTVDRLADQPIALDLAGADT